MSTGITRPWTAEEDEALARGVGQNPVIYIGPFPKVNFLQKSQKQINADWDKLAAQLKFQARTGKACRRRFRELHGKYILLQRAGNADTAQFPLSDALNFLEGTVKRLRNQKLPDMATARKRRKVSEIEMKSVVTSRPAFSLEAGEAVVGIIENGKDSVRTIGNLRGRTGLTGQGQHEVEPKVHKRRGPKPKPKAVSSTQLNGINGTGEITSVVNNGNSPPEKKPDLTELQQRIVVRRRKKKGVSWSQQKKKKSGTEQKVVRIKLPMKRNSHGPYNIPNNKPGRPSGKRSGGNNVPTAVPPTVTQAPELPPTVTQAPEPELPPTVNQTPELPSTGNLGNQAQAPQQPTANITTIPAQTANPTSSVPSPSCSSNSNKDGAAKTAQNVPLFRATCIPPSAPHMRSNGPNILFSNYVASVLGSLPDSEAVLVRNKIHQVLHEAQVEHFSHVPDTVMYLNNHTGDIFEVECGNCSTMNTLKAPGNN